MPPGRRLEDLTGRTFGRWRVLRLGGKLRYPATMWLCVCDPQRGGCGAEREIPAGRLKDGRSKGCKSCTSAERARRQHAAGVYKGKAARLTMKIHPGECRACGKEFTGTARQVYCSPKCWPSLRKQRSVAHES